MTRGDRYRSRLMPRDTAEYLKNFTTRPAYVNRHAHRNQHANQVLTYTSLTSLTTTAGSPIYPPQAIRLISMYINVAGAPASTLTCDLLLNGVSVFPTGWDKPTIPAGQLYSASRQIIGSAHVLPINADYLQVQVTTTGSATGPLIAAIQYRFYR